MKTRSILYIAICLFIGMGFMFSSCRKEGIYDPNNVNKTTDLKIPAGFDWNTTQPVTLSISSEVSATASLYLDKNCSAGQLVADVAISPESARTLTVDVPNTNREIYVQYTTKQGTRKVLTYELSGLTKAWRDIDIKLPEDTQENQGNFSEPYDIFYAAGNVMFEDNWPKRGDYDFNDFVIRYKIETWTTRDGKVDEEGMYFRINFLGIGGQYPYHLGLQLDRLPAKYIDEFSVVSATQGITAELVNPGAETPAVFIFKGTEALKKQNGAKYFNTEEGHITTNTSKLPEINFKIKVNTYENTVKYSALYHSGFSKNQNFFLQKNGQGGTEIHLKGYEPTYMYKEKYEEEAAGLMSSVKYCDKDNFVWGIKTFWNTAFPMERIDIIEAFPMFKNWVSSNGSFEYASWFKEGNYIPGKVVKIY